MKKEAEYLRLLSYQKKQGNWKKWGPYLSERAWGTVREDYSINGEAWDSFPHAHARSRAYRWNEDGLGGICDRDQYLCFALALWNEKDEMLKERLYGLVPREGNHGEDVKEYYFYLDSTPTHSYMKMLYKYPQRAYPYKQLVAENQSRDAYQPEYELLDTGVFDEDRYFDVFIEYAKQDQDDILIKITAINRGPEPAPFYVLPTLWFRNTWSWGYANGPMGDITLKPNLRERINEEGLAFVEASHPVIGTYYLYSESPAPFLFTENETNFERLYHRKNLSLYVKDAFHRYLIEKEQKAVNPQKMGTKTAAHFQTVILPQDSFTVRLRLTKNESMSPFEGFENIFRLRKEEADEFYASVQKESLSEEEKIIQRQAFAGLLWSKQFYYYDVQQWLEGDSQSLSKLVPRHLSRNKDWIHLVNFDVISMPDKWEYPWYASWDLAFHCIPLVLIDPDFAKRQLILMTREWYMHPNGQLPAYEWNFSDVNPPVLAWAAWRVYKIDGKQTGKMDRSFLEAIFHKLLLNFTWWVNQKDKYGNNVFQGGFLGLDNISIFDRSTPLVEGYIDQSDGTAWMGFYSILMMKIALELSRENTIYQDLATKFFEHFLRIASAMIEPGLKGYSLWDDQDGFFYDVFHHSQGQTPLRIRSLVGLLPLLAVETIEPDLLQALPIFKTRMTWFMSQRPDFTHAVACIEKEGAGQRHLLSLLTRERLISTLRYMFDENEFLSDYGIRSLSKYHKNHPYHLYYKNQDYQIDYQPGDAIYRQMAGGNSNWRGPIWFPLNFLIIEALQRFHRYYGDTLQAEYPTGSRRYMNLWDISVDLSQRLISLFIKQNGKRAIYGEQTPFQNNPHWQDLFLFHEFFHGDSGLGLGASHQTGWTSLVAKLLQQSG
jgi:hypothetical protein